MSMQQITVIGTGHIGGSFALAVKAAGYGGRVVGCDRPEVLELARARNLIDEAVADPQKAIRGSDVVVLATPIGAIVDLIERIGPLLPATTLLTDTGSTKVQIVERARAVFGRSVGERFLGGHPMAGRERSGVEQATADLFRGACWIFTPLEGSGSSPLASEFMQLVRSTGAQTTLMNPSRHDQVCAWVSHLPQMLATALGVALLEEIGDDAQALGLRSRGLREMTRTAASPYSVWRDIALTNAENLHPALLRLEQHLAHLRENLKTRGLEEEFEKANEMRRRLEHSSRG
jgi:prephenate dehydrogenase